MTEIAASKIAETAKKEAEITKDIERSQKEIQSKEKLLEIELKRGFETIGTRKAIEQEANRIELKNRELNRLK